MKKCLVFFLALILAFSLLPAPAVWAASPAPSESAQPSPQPTPKPEVFSDILAQVEEPRCKAALLMDVESGEVLYDFHGDEHNYPASITKVMTALLTLEEVEAGRMRLDQLVTASDTFGYDLEAGGTTQNIKPGEEMTVLDLLYCALIPSANEACNILAEAVSGSIPAFIDKMNDRAAQLGMSETHFANAHGLHNANHYTTARDIARMVCKALDNDTFITIVSARSHVVPETNLHGQRKLSSTNALINPLYNGAYTYPKAIGVKTGSTTAAGKCLVSAAVSGGEKLVCVVLGAEEIKKEDGSVDRPVFSESKRLLQWGFANFSRKSLFDPQRPVKEIAVELSADTTAVALKPQEGLEVILPKDLDPADFNHDIVIYSDTVAAPVEAGQVLGEMTVRNGNTVYGTVKLVAAASAQRSHLLWRVRQVKDFFAQTWVKVALVAAGVLVAALIIRVTMFRPKKGYHGPTRRGSRGKR